MGRVSFEVCGIDGDGVDESWSSELDIDPVESWRSSPSCFPSVAHIFSFCGSDEGPRVAEVCVVVCEYFSAIGEASDIDSVVRSF